MTTVLIANRGEIALRIHRAAASLGLRTVAVFAPEDSTSRHVQVASEAHPLDGELGYLDAEQLVSIAGRTGCTLVHPGYGFLSESAEFAARCADAGLTFTGPSPEVLALLGDKARARELARNHDVPVLAATSGGTTLAEAERFLTGLGPAGAVMVKAVAGGGGRGMRVVDNPGDLAWAVERCRSEAERGFGRGDLFVEEYLRHARHVEVQIIGDGSGEVAHLWDRDCTLQRRHQKLIETAPCTTLTPQQRQPLLGAACRLASAVNYSGLGTFEFLVDADDPTRFAFLEANPRVQVEHTVTEAVTGVDLVAAGLRVALGSALADLGLTQDQVPAPRGLALQCRVNLEQVDAGGTAHATSGVLEEFAVPAGPGIRVDTHGYRGLRCTSHFDSLLAKVIIHIGQSELASAATAADLALADFHIAGPATNIEMLRALLRHSAFGDGKFTTTFVDDHLAELVPATSSPSPGPEGEVIAPFAGTVVAVEGVAGEHVTHGAALIVVEAMKMEHVLTAPSSGTLTDVPVAAGSVVEKGQSLVRLQPDDVQPVLNQDTREIDLDKIRDDLAEVRQRHQSGLDDARPGAVAKRRRTGQRTARENIIDLCDRGTFTEYGALTLAAQRQRRSLDDLIASTPADGMVTGIGQVNGETFSEARSRCAVLSYDYTVLAGTQGVLNHRKTDRMLELAQRQRLPVVLFAEGGGGRPGDTDTTAASGLDVTTFATMGRLNGLVPTIGIASGRCFAGNAALLGCCDLIIATRDATIGMGGPAMIEGGGLGRFRPEEVGPVSMQVPNGVIDVLVEDEPEAVSAAKRYLSYFQGAVSGWECADQRHLRHVVPENRVRVYDVRSVVDLVADTGSVFELRPEFGSGIITALIRIEGRPLGLVASNPSHLGGAIDTPAADKMARFLQLCEAHRLPVVSLCDTPGFMVGPDSEETAAVRHFSRLFVAGSHLTVPVVGIVLRKGYGLGAMAMVGGGFRVPVATVAWPTGEVGGMGIEGAVRLGFRRELAAIRDSAERQQAFDDLLADAYARGKALNAAAVFELDDVIDPAETRHWIVRSLPPTVEAPASNTRFIDTW